ncbi:hypothetical protein [Paenibacillus sp. sgz500958]|uniref:hypothetical protein n=1 Tax=Paenibacillus sp. sgz500958 TaxID=3242475 RepID=UPI0036D21640
MKAVKMLSAFLLSATLVLVFLLTAPPHSNVRFNIAYLGFTLFIVAVFIYRIKKRTFMKYRREMIGMCISIVVLNFPGDIPMVLTVLSILLFVCLFAIGQFVRPR